MARLDSARMPSCEMARVILHWTAGTHTASANDREHYHVLVEGDGTVVYGKHRIDANTRPAREPRASHTRNLNTGSVGVAVCCMKDAKERPFSPGPFPMTIQQWQIAAEAVAELCHRYRIAVTPRTVLAHGEVQAVLKIEQLQKWDPLVLPWTPGIPRQQVMDQFRASVQEHLTRLTTVTAPGAPQSAPGAPLAAPPPLPSGGPFKPQTQIWRGDSAVLLVHGVGNAKPGDYAEIEQSMRAAVGPDVTIYSLFYDVFNDWLTEKTNFTEPIKQLAGVIKEKEGDGELPETISEFAGDVIWPLFAIASRAMVQRAYLAQMKQIVLDGLNTGRLKHQLNLSIVCHSLGCFHTYEMLHTIATEPAHTLQPLTDGIRFRSVVFMASPVQLIRTVGQAVSGLVPPNLATLATSGIGNPFEQALGVTRTAVERWVSITGDLDPIGGHFVRRKADWAYMNVAGQESIVVPQALLAGGNDEENLISVLKRSRNEFKPPSLNNPHSWLDYVNGHTGRFTQWFA